MMMMMMLMVVMMVMMMMMMIDILHSLPRVCSLLLMTMAILLIRVH